MKDKVKQLKKEQLKIVNNAVEDICSTEDGRKALSDVTSSCLPFRVEWKLRKEQND